FSFFFGVTYSLNLLTVPFLILSIAILSIGVSMTLASLRVKFKDLDNVWDIALLIGFWSVPIIWNWEILMNEYHFMLYINPVSGMLINLRNAMLYDTPAFFNWLAYDFGFGLLFLALGFILLKKLGSKIIEID